MALTKSVAAVDEWAPIAQNAVREGATTDVSGCYEAALHIDVALSTTAVAHTGTKTIIQVTSNTTGDEDWSDFMQIVGPTGTANSEAITNDPLAAASTTATVASTTGYVADGVLPIFILDGTVANSELCLLVSAVADTSLTWLDGTTNEHAVSTVIFNVVESFVIALPMYANRVRVIYDNTYDVDGSTVHTKCRISKVTAV